MKVEISANGKYASQEQKLEALGTVIADDGLTILPLSTVDPRNSPRLRSGLLVVATLKCSLGPDGTEIPAEILLQDADLDLAVHREKSPITPVFVALECFC